MNPSPAPLWVSVTGLRLRSPLHIPAFWWHATRAFAQARRAPGALRVEARSIGGVHHTLSVWRSEGDMRAYLVAGAHLAAMKSFGRMATGETVGYAAASMPTWDEALLRWRAAGRAV